MGGGDCPLCPPCSAGPADYQIVLAFTVRKNFLPKAKTFAYLLLIASYREMELNFVSISLVTFLIVCLWSTLSNAQSCEYTVDGGPVGKRYSFVGFFLLIRSVFMLF